MYQGGLDLARKEQALLERAGPSDFYRELSELGFGSDSCRAVLKILAKVYSLDPILFAGKNRATIESAITYATSVYLEFNNKLQFAGGELPTQYQLAKKFGVSLRASGWGCGNGTSWIPQECQESVSPPSYQIQRIISNDVGP